jgi:RhtB (resistance to homoserine/threonine) family protein
MISPGPDFILISKLSLEKGKEAGLLGALGISIGALFHSTYSMLGLGSWIQDSKVLFHAIRLAGSGYLIYLGISTLIDCYQSRKKNAEPDNRRPKSGLSSRSSFSAGLLTNILNPKATLFFMSIFTQLVDVTTPMAHRLVYIATMFIVCVMWFSFVAVLFSRNQNHWIQLFQRKGVPLMALLLIGIGIKTAMI